MKKYIFSFLFIVMCTVIGTVSSSSQVYAHSALLNCFDNADGTFTCQGGYSDGSSATGIRIVVMDMQNNILHEAQLNADSEVVMPLPQQKDFMVLFDGGAGHSVQITSDVLVR